MGKHALHKKSDKYEVKDGKLQRKARFCPKCGPGVILAKHGGRLHCGKCGYTEFPKSGKPAEPKQ